MTTLAEAFDNVPPVGKIYLPDCSYREMTEWALPTEQLIEYDRIADEMQNDPRWAALRPFVRGGFWRNFKVKYPEADEMYGRMMARQPPACRRRSPRPRPATRSMPSWSNRPGSSSTAASATAATGTGPSAASICRTCATPSIST